MQFNYDVSFQDEGPFVYLKLKGNLLERYQASEFFGELDAWIQDGKNKFILDLSKLEYINSNGLSVLINILTKSRNHGGDVVIFGVSDQLKNLFIITKLDNVFKTASDEKTAKEQLSI
jgi:anti-sigma B factor antagonist